MVAYTESVSPLPDEIRGSLIAMACIGLTSLVTSSLLFAHITWSLVRWKIRDARSQKAAALALATTATSRSTPGLARGGSIDLSLGLAESHYYQATTRKPGGGDRSSSNIALTPTTPQQPDFPPSDVASTTTKGGASHATTVEDPDRHAAARSTRPSGSLRRNKPPNPLLLLIYNLLLADMILSASYACAVSWLVRDGIVAPSHTCSAQGWIVSFGCLTTSGSLFSIAVFSYLGIIRGYKATTRNVVVACVLIWTMSVVLASLGPMYFRNGRFYGRETTWVSFIPPVFPAVRSCAVWCVHVEISCASRKLTAMDFSQCWIAEEHRIWRLSIYMWGFPAMAGTTGIYSTIFFKLWREGRSSRFMPRRHSSSSNNSSIRISSTDTNNGTALRPSGHHPAFLIYPCIYAVTGTPLIVGSLVPALERSPVFMATAGSLLAMTGLLDTLLWSSILLFSRSEDLERTGLDQFSFQPRTPEGRTLGNIVFVQGGGGESSAVQRQSWHSRKERGWWRLGERSVSGGGGGGFEARGWPGDQGERGVQRGIQMEVVTSVVVEIEPRSRSATRSMTGGRDTSMDSLK